MDAATVTIGSSSDSKLLSATRKPAIVTPLMTDLSAACFVGALGLAVGSFLNVCIYRLPRDQSVVRPPSRCPSCGRGLRWFENVPVAAWVVLGGRCRTCRNVISPMYPMVETVTAFMFTFHYWQLGWQPLLGVRLVFVAVMIVLCVIDFQVQILPDVITLPGVGIGLVAGSLLEPGWTSSLVGMVAGGGVLWVVGEGYLRIRGQQGMGMGDVKMLAMIGAFLGWPSMLITLLLASVLGSVVGVAMVLLNRGGMQSALPFGSFLAVSALISTCVGQPLLHWYLRLY